MTLQCYKNLYFHILFYEVHIGFLLRKNENNLDNRDHRVVFTLFFLIMLKGFFAAR